MTGCESLIIRASDPTPGLIGPTGVQDVSDTATTCKHLQPYIARPARAKRAAGMFDDDDVRVRCSACVADDFELKLFHAEPLSILFKIDTPAPIEWS